MIPREPEEGLASEAEPEVTEIDDIEILKQALAEEKEKAESYLTNWQRAQADFVNYKRRSEQEKEEVSQFVSSAFMLNLLPLLDDLERAFASIPPHLAELSWVDGIKLIERKLRASLEAKGLSPIKALGEPFDPKFHQAAMHGQGEEGVVIEELQKGYMLQDSILRPAIVVVGEGEVDEKREVEPENNSQGDSAPA